MTICYDCKYNPCPFSCDEKTYCQYLAMNTARNTDELTELKRMYKELEDLYDARVDYCAELKAEIEELKKTLEQADRSYDTLFSEFVAKASECEKLKAENEELKAQNNKLHQWTLNDKKIKYGFELAIETLNKCKEV